MEKLWGGRFNRNTDPEVERFTSSIYFDYLLLPEDVEGSIVHVEGLREAGLLSKDEASSLKQGLWEVLAELQEKIEQGEFVPEGSDEDIHMLLEKMVTEKVGKVGEKLHTGRSRNDQVAMDLHLYLKKEILKIDSLLLNFQETIVRLAEENTDIIMPGYTHLQRAQPVLFSHYLMAYFWMLQRDRERLKGVLQRNDMMPLGAGAFAGCGFPLNREKMARDSGFSRLYENSVDAVSDRDFVLEFLSFASINMMHLSRLCEELVLWSSTEFGFIELSQAHSTGSSIMPQKKNPDVAELVRGKTGRVYGSLIGLLTVLKGLPLAYNKDMQEDKEGLFDTVKTIKYSLYLCRKMLEGARFNKDKMRQAVEHDFSGATDLADYLVYKGVSFREAHGIIGKMVAYCEESGCRLQELNQEQLFQFHPDLQAEKIKELLDPLSSIKNKNLQGGTSPDAVRRQIEEARRCLKRDHY